MAILKIRDKNGNVQEILAIKGDKGDAYNLTDDDKVEIANLVVALIKDDVVIGNIDKDNNIILSGSIANGNYIVKYEYDDGTYEDIGTLEVKEKVAEINLFTTYTPLLNKRWSSSSKAYSTQNGCVALELPANEVAGKTMRFSGFLQKYGNAEPSWYAYDDALVEKAKYANVWSNAGFTQEDENTYSWVIPEVEGATKWHVFLVVSQSGAITESDLANVSWTLTE